MEKSDIVVSIICCTYNQEKYISKAIDSFLKQKTNFKYEIIIHDDASTDETTSIIKHYSQKYPDVIVPIIQIQNKYSLGTNIFVDYLFPIVRGKYVALCEGDDYWIDEEKIQKQYDAMENHNEVDMCTHAALRVKDDKCIGFICPSKNEKIFDVKDVIEGGGGLWATNSIFFRSSMLENIPDFVNFFCLDYAMQVWGSLRGGVLYLPDKMSAYRVCADNSFTLRLHNSREKCIMHYNKVIKLKELMKKHIDDELKIYLEKTIKFNRYELLYYEMNYKRMISKDFKDVFNQRPILHKIKIYLLALFGNHKLFLRLCKIKRVFKDERKG